MMMIHPCLVTYHIYYDSPCFETRVCNGPSGSAHIIAGDIPSQVDPSAAAASRRAEFLGMPRAAADFFMAQPNPSRIFQTFQPAEYFSAQIRREHTA